MAFESLNDKKINELIVCPKRVTNPGAKSKNKGGHEQINYKVNPMM